MSNWMACPECGADCIEDNLEGLFTEGDNAVCECGAHCVVSVDPCGNCNDGCGECTAAASVYESCDCGDCRGDALAALECEVG